MARRARVLPPKEMTVAEVYHEQIRVDRQTPTKEFKTLPEKVAQSSIFYKNWYVPELREKFKYFDRMKRIDMVFPYARPRGKPEMLLVDLPANETETEQCAMKAKMLNTLGYLYCWIEKDSSLSDVLMQIGEI